MTNNWRQFGQHKGSGSLQSPVHDPITDRQVQAGTRGEPIRVTVVRGEPAPPDPAWRRLMVEMLRRGEPAPQPPEDTPCKDSVDFRILEAEANDVAHLIDSDARTGSRRVQYLERAAAAFCDGCPFGRGCEDWARADGDYEGIANGKLIISRSRAEYREWIKERRTRNGTVR